MNQASALCALHERLTTDTRSAFDAIGSYHDHAEIEPTEAGRDWLRSHDEYRAVWEQLVREGKNPERILLWQFGFIPGGDEERPGRRSLRRNLGQDTRRRDGKRRYKKRGLERPDTEE